MRYNATALLIVIAWTPQAVFANETTHTTGGVTENFRLEDLSSGEEKHRARTTTTLEGRVGMENQFVDDDLFMQIDRPVGVAEAQLQLTPEFGLYAWSAQSLDIDTRVGDELYVSGFYRNEIGEAAAVELEVGRSFIRGAGFNDMWVFTATLEVESFDLSISQFVVDDLRGQDPGDGDDATRLQLGYSRELMKGVTSRFFITYETGFAVPDITTAGVQLEVALSNRWSLQGKFIAPLATSAGNSPSAAAMFGVSYSF